VVLLLLLLALPAAAETVDILRDGYGTPHVFATTPAGAAFGAGYAQAQDRPAALLKNLSVEPESIPLTPEVQAIVSAYVAGANRVFGEPRITAEQVVAFSRRAYTWIHGSNDFSLPANRTTANAVTVVLNPVADWNALDRPYEMSLYASTGDLSIAGVAPLGMPFPVVGHNQRVAIGWSGDPGMAGPQAMEEAWALITARSIEDLRRALAMGQIPGRVTCGTSTGEFCQEGLPDTLHPVIREKLRVQNTWSLPGIESLVFDVDVYKAEAWQTLLSRVVPDSRFGRVLSGWNRRADAESRGALAFYLFKMALDRDASALEPPDSLSTTRIRAALTKAQDRLETELDFNATYGTIFRIHREDSRESFPAAGGNLPEAGMETPRALSFRSNRAYAGHAAPRIIQFSRATSARSVLLPGVSDDPESRHFFDQADLKKTKPTYFRNRRELERATSSRKQLTF